LRSNSNDTRKLLVPRTHNKLGDRSFSAAGPRLWNDLPPGLRRPGLTLDSFRQSIFLSILWVKLLDMFVTLLLLKYALSVGDDHMDIC